MAQPVGGNQSFAAAVTYTPAPVASFARGEVRYLDDTLSDYVTTSADALVGEAYDFETVYSAYTGWSQSVGAEAETVIDLGEARSADSFVVVSEHSSGSFRPTAALLEWSDDDSSYTTVTDYSGLTAQGLTTPHGWLIFWDTTGLSHRYWRLTLTHPGQLIHISAILFGNRRPSLGRNVTMSPAAHATYPNYPVDVIYAGDSDWNANVGTMLAGGPRANQLEGFANGYTAVSQTTNDTVSYTLDQGSAVAADRLQLKGYHGTDAIFRPIVVLLEYSDNGSDWTTHENKTGLTGGGGAGVANWWVISDISDETHRYWRATLTHGGTWLFVSTMETVSGWVNVALARPYTVSGSVSANFPNNFAQQLLGPGDADWVAGGGKLTNGEIGWPGSFATGVGWAVNTSDTRFVRVDLGSAVEGDHMVIHGIHGSSTSMRTPGALLVEYSDNDSDWTSVANKTGLTQAFNAKGRWAFRVDVSAEGAHQYWRATMTHNGANGLFLVFTQVEFFVQTSTPDPPDPPDPPPGPTGRVIRSPRYAVTRVARR